MNGAERRRGAQAAGSVIAEADDRSDGIYDRDTGALIAQGELGLPVFVGVMQASTGEIIRLIREGRVAAPQPGDIYIVNDPYLGGTHLMDVRFAMPFFHDGALSCWLQNIGHWPDTGGMTPGGFSARATESEQEGLRLPPVKLFKQGRLDGEILSIILSNIRVADQRIGDIQAQAAALRLGERRLSKLLRRYSRDVVERVIAEMRVRAGNLMRAKLTAVPDGRYESEAFVDSDRVVNEPLRIALAMTKADGALTFDFSRSSAPCRGPMNSVFATTLSSVYLAVRHVFPDVPLNAGAFEPLRVIRPAGTFLDARYPRPVSGCAAEVSQRIAKAVFLALVQAVPELVTASPSDTNPWSRRPSTATMFSADVHRKRSRRRAGPRPVRERPPVDFGLERSRRSVDGSLVIHAPHGALQRVRQLVGAGAPGAVEIEASR